MPRPTAKQLWGAELLSAVIAARDAGICWICCIRRKDDNPYDICKKCLAETGGEKIERAFAIL